MDASCVALQCGTLRRFPRNVPHVPHKPQCASIQRIVPHTLIWTYKTQYNARRRAAPHVSRRRTVPRGDVRCRAAPCGAATQRNASGVNEPLQLARPRCRVTGLTVRTFTWTVSSEPCHFLWSPYVIGQTIIFCPVISIFYLFLFLA